MTIRFRSSRVSRLQMVVLSFAVCAIVTIFGNSLLPPCPDHEKFSLFHLKESFLIDCTASAFDPSAYPRVKSWDIANNCCLWDGVECSQNTGHVIGLDLSSSCLRGTITGNSTLFSLTHLETLNLAFNDFNYSHIPPEIGHFIMLKSLNLSNSAFSGQIPLEISQLSRLSILDLSWNGHSSANTQLDLRLKDPSLEKIYRNLTRLTHLDLTLVDISSTVPTTLANLTSLKVIVLTICNLYGALPTSIFHLPRLEFLRLDGNRELTGTFPQFNFGSPLKELDLFSVAFSGQLPPSIGNLASLEILELMNCNLTGFIPPSLGNLTNLNHLGLANNYFVGNFPPFLTNLTQLRQLDLSNLRVRQGNLMSQLPQLHRLTILRLAGLNLAGEVPSFLANFTSLRFLDLNGNQLTGPLPHWFTNLTRLSSLYLKDNHLEGPIPNWFSQLSNIQSLEMSNNNLFGTINTFLNLEKLLFLSLDGINLTFPSISNTNSSRLKLNILNLGFCNLAEFPQFLRNQDKLQAISLKGNNIHGKVQEWFVNITKETLLSINLSNNKLTGFEKPTLVLPWNNLEIMDLSFNRFAGPLPRPPNHSIMMYSFSNNHLTGGIPDHICGSSSLALLDLSNNNMSGRIPPCVGEWLGKTLLALNLQGNNFHGRIPPTFKKSCKLKMINLSQNRLDGQLPKSLLNCTMLEILDLGKNRVNDTFPAWLGSLHALQVLVLNHNNFYGRIEGQESDLDFSQLHILDMSYNHLTGGLPAGYFQKWPAMREPSEDRSEIDKTMIYFYFEMNMHSFFYADKSYNYSITITNKGRESFFSRVLNVFRVLDFSSNNFINEIPDSIGDLKGLQALNLSNNNLNGGIPVSVAKIRDLESLDLSRNMLIGEIPRELSQLTSLEVFNVSFNHLIGPIPQGNQFDTFDDSSFYGNSELCGSLLTSKCEISGTELPLKPVTNEKGEENSKLIDWVIRTLGCVSGFVVGFVIGKFHVTDKHHDWFIDTFGRRQR
ncbi:receptor-like protein 7 [Silene latifolia]|uniref:receptor-like protein 7 n=1 Tax=Silene latifolia TaxID=37657 RepID=UPI003D771BD4